MKIPLLDLKAQFQSVRPEIEAAINRTLQSQRFILGPAVEEFEKQIALYVGTEHAIGVSSGTDALLMCLMALDMQPGDEIITTAFSFFATAGSIVRAGAQPVFLDIVPETFQLDVAGLANRIGPKTRAIIPVHLFGRCTSVEKIAALAPQIPVIEDAAQALGAEQNGKKAGTLGLAGCFSFFPSKNLGGYGDGGIITVADSDFAKKLRALRVHGQIAGARYEHQLVGGNFRLDAIQAAILSAKLPYLEKWTEARRKNAQKYRELFRQSGVQIILPPEDEPRSRDVYNQFVVRVRNRDQLSAFLTEHGIGNAVYYPQGLHTQPCFSNLGYKRGDFPNTEKAAQECLALPVYPELTDAQLCEVVERILEFQKKEPPHAT
ncbi:MAG: DegT/DnrJ/EryC1/StrS family aminotransferase [Pseudomonadota bacterium]